jgi:hypothetical protein
MWSARVKQLGKVFMRQTLVLILALLIISSAACAPDNSKEVKAITQSASPAKVMYITGQVEWIARSFSPECRVIKKPTEAKSSG